MRLQELLEVIHDTGQHYDYSVGKPPEILPSGEEIASNEWSRQEVLYWKAIGYYVAADRAIGIKSCVYFDKRDKLFYYLRDSRFSVAESSGHESFFYLVMAYNYTIAFCNILQVRNSPSFSNGLGEVAGALAAIESSILVCDRPEDQFKSYVHYLSRWLLLHDPDEASLTTEEQINHLQCHEPKEYKAKISIQSKQLDKIKNWGGLELPSMTMVSFLSVKSDLAEPYAMVLMDKPITNNNMDSQYNQGVDLSDKPWYSAMSQLEKGVFELYRPKLAEGRVLPSQLRSRGPEGIKNFYHSKSWVIPAASFEHATIDTPSFSFYHSGSWVQFASQESQLPSAKRAFQQFGDAIRPQQSDQVRINAYTWLLNSTLRDKFASWQSSCLYLLCCGYWCCPKRAPKPEAQYDSGIVNNVLQANQYYSPQPRRVEEQKDGESDGIETRLLPSEVRSDAVHAPLSFTAHVSDMAVNFWRRFQGVKSSYCFPYGAKQGTIDALLANIDQVLEIEPRLVGQSGEDHDREDLSGVQYHFSRLKLLRAALDERFKRWAFRRDKNLNAVSIIASCIEVDAHITHLRQQYQDDLQNVPSQVQLFCCASGENRTGLVWVCTQVDVAQGSRPELNTEHLIEQLIQSWHAQTVMGAQASNPGAAGLRPKSIGAFPDRLLPYTKADRPRKTTSAKLNSGLFSPCADLKGVGYVHDMPVGLPGMRVGSGKEED